MAAAHLIVSRVATVSSRKPAAHQVVQVGRRPAVRASFATAPLVVDGQLEHDWVDRPTGPRGPPPELVDHLVAGARKRLGVSWPEAPHKP